MQTLIPGFDLQGDDIYLEGIGISGEFLWNRKKRAEEMRVHVEALKALPPETTPILLSIDYLPLLLSLDIQRDVIVIEKSKSYAEFTVGSAQLDAHQNIKLVIGEIGWLGPQKIDLMERSTLYPEVAGIALQLFNLPDELWKQVQICVPEIHPLEKTIQTVLVHIVDCVWQAKNFHQKNKQNYADYLAGSSTNSLGVLLRSQGEIEDLVKRYALVEPSENLRPLVLEYGEPNIIGTSTVLFSKYSWNRPWDSEEKTYFSDAMGRAQKLWNFLLEHRPRAILLRNQAAFDSIPDVLLLNGMLQRLGIPTYEFYADWMTQISSIFQAGWCFEPYNRWWKNSDRKKFILYTFHGAFSTPENYKSITFPYRFISKGVSLRAPKDSLSEMQLDIAIIHSTRSIAALYTPINELYEMIVAVSKELQSKASVKFLVRMRRKLKMEQYPMAWFSFLNAIDYMFYAQDRIRDVVTFVNRLQANFKIKVYGDEWQKYLPQNLCGGFLKGIDAVCVVYRHSLVTLDFARGQAVGEPHQNVFDCIVSGGYGMNLSPSLTHEGEYFSKAIPRDAIPFFDSPDQISEIVTSFKNDFSLRNHSILKAQNTWLKEFNELKPIGFDQLLKQQPISFKDYAPSIGKDELADEFLLEVAIGYFYHLSGFHEKALQGWQAALEKYDYFYAPFIKRAESVARAIKNYKALEFFKEKLKKNG